jgi:poly(3-hydroxybutyrate) depolymerase
MQVGAPATRRVPCRLAVTLVVAGLTASVIGVASLAPAGATERDREGTATVVASFPDVPTTHPFVDEITWLAEQGIATGYDDGTFRPGRPVTRQAIAAFLHRYVGPGGSDACTAPPFPDVPADHPFCAAIAWLAEAGLAQGYDDGTFRPAATITRHAAAAFLFRLAGSPVASAPACPPPPFTDVPADHPFCAAIAWAAAVGVTTGDHGGFRPADAVSRQAFAAFLHRYERHDAAPVPSPGCGSSTAVPVVNQRRDLDIGGSARWFLHTVPSAHDGDTPLPLVVDFHGFGEGATIHTSMSEASTFAEQEGFVVAFPHGRFDPVRWDAADQSDANEDLVFVDAILATLGDELCVDESRVYAMGLSYGAFMTSMITCARSERFAAVAPVAGVRAPDPCPQAREVPVVSFHGTEDPILAYASYPVAAATWAARNGCDSTPLETVLTPEVTHRVWDCPKDAAVEFYVLPGGGHSWPGSAFSRLIEAIVGYTTFDIHATATAWAFFERFHL